jgi:hypothetical protein
MAAAMAKVREAVRIMEKALPGLQVGSKPYEAVVEALRKISKEIPATEEMPGITNATLMGLQRDAREGSQMQALMRAMAAKQQAGGGGMPGQAPPMTPQPPGM